MPLTYVVEFLNTRLKELHPDSLLARYSSLSFQEGEVSAHVHELVVTSQLHPVTTDHDRHTVLANNSRLLVRTLSGSAISESRLYLLAWNSADVLFLDRMLRVLHCLHHINLAADQTSFHDLIVDVHFRHLKSVQSDHGLVFEGLIQDLGLDPSQLILRFKTSAFRLDHRKLERAFKSYQNRGYRLLLEIEHSAELWSSDVDHLGIDYITFSASLDTVIKEQGLDELSQETHGSKMALLYL
jgi:hypothetical protein